MNENELTKGLLDEGITTGEAAATPMEGLPLLHLKVQLEYIDYLG